MLLGGGLLQGVKGPPPKLSVSAVAYCKMCRTYSGYLELLAYYVPQDASSLRKASGGCWPTADVKTLRIKVPTGHWPTTRRTEPTKAPRNMIATRGTAL